MILRSFPGRRPTPGRRIGCCRHANQLKPLPFFSSSGINASCRFRAGTASPAPVACPATTIYSDEWDRDTFRTAVYRCILSSAAVKRWSNGLLLIRVTTDLVVWRRRLCDRTDRVSSAHRRNNKSGEKYLNERKRNCTFHLATTKRASRSGNVLRTETLPSFDVRYIYTVFPPLRIDQLMQ